MSTERITFGDRVTVAWLMPSYIFSWRTFLLWLSPWLHMAGCPDEGCGTTHVAYVIVAKHRARELLTERQYVVLDKLRRKLSGGDWAIAFGDPDNFLDFVNDLCVPTDERKRRELRTKLGQDAAARVD